MPGEVVVETLLRDLIPHAPNLGVYVDPHIPSRLLRNAIGDYAPQMDPGAVIALLDLTLLGTAKDGAVLSVDRMVFQNTNLERPQLVYYRDLVGARIKRGLFGCKLILSVNSGRATIEATIDFSGRKKAVKYFHRFFQESSLLGD